MPASITGEQFRSRAAVLTFGGLQVFLGVCLISLHAAEFALFGPFPGGIWPGLIVVASGTLGMAGGRHIAPETDPRSRRCLLISCLAFTAPAVTISTFMLLYGIFQVFFSPRLSVQLTGSEAVCLNLKTVICLFMFNMNVGQLSATSASLHELRRIRASNVRAEQTVSSTLDTNSFDVSLLPSNATLPPYCRPPVPLQRFADKDSTQKYDFKYDFIKVKV